jgi:hypothetical protein
MDATSIGTLLTGAGTFLTAALGFHNGRKANSIKQDVAGVQQTVNGAATAERARTDQLAGALADADVKIPDRPHDGA